MNSDTNMSEMPRPTSPENNVSHNMRALPQYQCFKKIWALKIAAIEIHQDGSATIAPKEQGYKPFNVPAKFMPKHGAARPEEGWYWIQYEDGYQSFSPAAALEDGYFPCHGSSPFLQVQTGTHGPKRVMFTMQDGPIKEVGENGIQIDGVIEWARETIEGFNARFPCRENSLALTKLDEALMWLAARKANREKRGVEGTTVA